MIKFEELDPSLISENPFSFKDNPGDAARELQNRLAYFAAFFAPEISTADEVYAAWNALQSAKGGVVAVRLSFSVENAQGIRALLDTLNACGTDHPTDRISILLVLVHIALLEFVEGGAGYTSFSNWALSGINRGDLDGDMPAREFLIKNEDRYLEEHGSFRSFKRAIREGTTAAEKRMLLRAFTFSEPYKLGQRGGRPQHLHCAAWERDNERLAARSERPRHNVRELCDEACASPLATDVARDLSPFLRHMYDMRSDFVHNGSPVNIARRYEPGAPRGPLWDLYFKGDTIVSYEVTLSAGDVADIFRRCLWRRINTLGVSPTPGDSE